METSRKGYWKQTVKLALVSVGLVLVAGLCGGYIGFMGGEVTESTVQAINAVTSILFIVAAVILYKGYSFWYGIGGYLLVKIVVSFLVVAALAQLHS